METTTTKTADNYWLSSFIYITSTALERAGYYGLRSLIVLYMVGETLQMDHTQALSIYGWLTTIIAITPIIGAVIGDLIIGNKWTAFSGGVLQALGAFVLCVPSLTMFYIGIGLIALGTGLYVPNLMANFGKVQRKRVDHMDGGFTLLYTVINIAAFLGVLALAFLGDIGFAYGFIASGVLLLLASVVLIFTPGKQEIKAVDSNPDPTREKASTPTTGWLMVLIAVALSTVFWALYEMGNGLKMSGMLMELTYQYADRLSTEFLYNVPQYVVIFLGLIGVIAWHITQVDRIVKISLGFVMSSLAFAVLIFIPENSPTILMAILLISALFIGLGEILIAPTINSLITLFSNPKYLAIIFALTYLPFRIAYYLVSLVVEAGYEAPKLGIGITAVLFLLVGIGIFVFYAVTRNSKSTTIQS
ncbi:MAG: MFS transporter [Bacteroidota bacterium]